MNSRQAASSGEGTWALEQIPYHTIERARVCEDIQLLYIIASASFIEITSDLHVHNLLGLMRNDREEAEWLVHRWQSDELRHGAALRRYIQEVWPEFKWGCAYITFLEESREFYSAEHLAATPLLEMLARCVIETGTAVFYRILANSTSEPVLKLIASLIASDEIRHYTHFYRAFARIRSSARIGRTAVFRKLLERIGEIHSDDGFIAFKNVYLTHNPGTAFVNSDYDAFREGVRTRAKANIPYHMAIAMLLRPLELSPAVRRTIVPPAVWIAQLLTTDPIGRWLFALRRKHSHG